MDNVQSVHGLSGHCLVHLDSLAFVQGVHGQCPDCPLSPWTMSTESMENVHWIHGHCPVWLVSLDFVHRLTGLCPEYPWTLSRLSTESMVNVHWVYGQCPGNPLSPWTFYRREHLSKEAEHWGNNCSEAEHDCLKAPLPLRKVQWPFQWGSSWQGWDGHLGEVHCATHISKSFIKTWTSYVTFSRIQHQCFKQNHL